MSPTRTRTPLSLLLALAPACGSANVSDGPDSASESGTADATATTTDAPTTTATTGPVEPEWTPTLVGGGLEIDWVEANQGIGVAIGRDGDGVPGDMRSSYLMQGRITLIRAFWKELPADWIPRKIEGRLIITYADGTEKVLTKNVVVEGESFVGNLKQSFFWGLKAEEVIPGMRYRIEMWETEEGHALLPEPLPVGAVPPTLPHDEGTAFVGIEDSDQKLKVTLVPFHYNDGMGCNTVPDTSEETMKLFTDYMFMMNPIDELQFTMHAPIEWNEPLSDFNELNQFMSGLRSDEQAPPNMYYYGLVDVCAGGLGGAGGKAYGIPVGGGKQDAWQRVSSGLSSDPVWSAETFVHEVGHSQGRYHVHCNGDEGGPDWSYPHDNGEIGEWGFGVINFQLYHPTVHRDYMTYCHPVWASTWGWNKVYPTIKQLSSWDLEGAPADDGPVGSLLVGSIYPNGEETWITVPGALTPEQRSAVHSVEFYEGGELVAAEAAAYLPQPDGDVVNVVAPLPAGFDRVTEIVRVAGDKRTKTQAKKIGLHHAPKSVTAAP